MEIAFIVAALVVAWAFESVKRSRGAKVLRNVKRAQRLVSRVHNGKG